MHLPHGILPGREEHATAQVLDEQVALGPETLQIQRPQNSSCRFQLRSPEFVVDVGVRRLTYLKSGRDEAAGRSAHFERRLVKSGDWRIFRVQYRCGLSVRGCRSRIP